MHSVNSLRASALVRLCACRTKEGFLRRSVKSSAAARPGTILIIGMHHRAKRLPGGGKTQ